MLFPFLQSRRVWRRRARRPAGPAPRCDRAHHHDGRRQRRSVGGRPVLDLDALEAAAAAHDCMTYIDVSQAASWLGHPGRSLRHHCVRGLQVAVLPARHRFRDGGAGRGRPAHPGGGGLVCGGGPVDLDLPTAGPAGRRRPPIRRVAGVGRLGRRRTDVRAPRRGGHRGDRCRTTWPRQPASRRTRTWRRATVPSSPSTCPGPSTRCALPTSPAPVVTGGCAWPATSTRPTRTSTGRFGPACRRGRSPAAAAMPTTRLQPVPRSSRLSATTRSAPTTPCPCWARSRRATYTRTRSSPPPWPEREPPTNS